MNIMRICTSRVTITCTFAITRPDYHAGQQISLAKASNAKSAATTMTAIAQPGKPPLFPPLPMPLLVVAAVDGSVVA